MAVKNDRVEIHQFSWSFFTAIDSSPSFIDLTSLVPCLSIRRTNLLIRFFLYQQVTLLTPEDREVKERR
jgi:hypothetical protein